MECSSSVSFVQPPQKSVDLVRPHAKSRPTRKNVSMSIISRRYGIFSKDAGTLLRKNMKILRQIVLQDTTNFTKVWAMHSKSPIAYESGRIYFENYRCCYSSCPSKPQFLYELPKRTKAEKLEDALLCQCPLSEALSKPSDQNPCLLALAADNWLYRFSIKTGEQLQKVYLSPHHKFRYLGWDVSQETFYIKSVQNKQTPLVRQAGVDQSTLLYLAVFKVVPLELVGVLEISRRVFGCSVVDVILSQGVLAVSYSSKVVKLYSFENIVQKYTTKKLVLGERCEWNGVWATIGEPPFGIPVNISISDDIPVLFEMSCFNNGIQIGGHPWHYIFTPNNKRHQGTHHICSLQDGSLAKNGIQDMNCCSLESDWIYFHPDDSGRIIHVGPSTINVLKILKTQECCSQSEVVPEFSITAHRVNNQTASKDSVTSSGRVVKRRYHQLDDDPGQETFRMVEYEDELDLLAVVEVMNTEEEGKAHVCLHDNQTGMFKKKVPLVESWDVTYSHKLFFDLETIIHIEQKKHNQFCCHVYKITCRRPD
ncbi:DDB1- and CUL4-associated factor 17 isoform X1 [Anguilla anguilla]|uniref:DDB1- and CUL4-associated factor 17 isoform X1 n=1 Tax=Anguilla anguilla TaxID=7936 RepID=UPI0015AE104C|nr:DDB1- and CUL4-associated factor 17 isoform X1 [Anguilla anguilla]